MMTPTNEPTLPAPWRANDQLLWSIEPPLAGPNDQIPDGARVAGRFVVQRLAGRGAGSMVYAARDEELYRDVALKVLDADAKPDTTARFAREARFLGKLRHPNVVRVFDVARLHDGRLVIAMELLQGETLEDRVRRSGLSAPEAVAIARSVLAALDEAHAERIVHRDVKPSNVFLSRRPDGSVVTKLLDFGVSYELDDPSRLTAPGHVVGTPSFIPPEQFLNLLPRDHRADIYGAGALIHFMLTRTPFFGETRAPAALLLAALLVEPSSLAGARLGVGNALASVVRRALAKHPEARWQTADAMSEALRIALELDGYVADTGYGGV